MQEGNCLAITLLQPATLPLPSSLPAPLTCSALAPTQSCPACKFGCAGCCCSCRSSCCPPPANLLILANACPCRDGRGLPVSALLLDSSLYRRLWRWLSSALLCSVVTFQRKSHAMPAGNSCNSPLPQRGTFISALLQHPPQTQVQPTPTQQTHRLCTTMSVHNTTREGNGYAISSDSAPTLLRLVPSLLLPHTRVLYSCSPLPLVMMRLHCVNAFC